MCATAPALRCLHDPALAPARVRMLLLCTLYALSHVWRLVQCVNSETLLGLKLQQTRHIHHTHRYLLLLQVPARPPTFKPRAHPNCADTAVYLFPTHAHAHTRACVHTPANQPILARQKSARERNRLHKSAKECKQIQKSAT